MRAVVEAKQKEKKRTRDREEIKLIIKKAGQLSRSGLS
jgi:hypothetical protein